MLRLLQFAALATVAFGKHEIYDGFKVYKVSPTTDEHFRILRQVEELVPGADFWIKPIPRRNRVGYVMIPPAGQNGFETTLALNGLDFDVDVPNVKNMLEIEDKILDDSTRNSNLTKNGPLEYDRYHRYQRIDDYLMYLGRTYPERVKVVLGGTSFHGRSIKYVEVSSSGFQDATKPIIYFDGGIHAREWIAPPSVTYVLYKLVENIDGHDLVQDIDFVILPLVNPDGYEYSHTDARLWRKTRSTSNGVSCPGVDGNRNFDIAWMEVGSSSNPCSETYAGHRPFSEPETNIVRNILFRYYARLKLYVTFHSFGSMILYPWGNNNSLPSNGAQLREVGLLAGQAIDLASLPGSPAYIVDNSVVAIQYAVSGASEDYGRSIGIPLSYTIELPGRPSGFQSGFELPPSEINQVVTETYAGVKVFAEETLARHHNGELISGV